jgi:hypothetical protein
MMPPLTSVKLNYIKVFRQIYLHTLVKLVGIWGTKVLLPLFLKQGLLNITNKVYVLFT